MKTLKPLQSAAVWCFGIFWPDHFFGTFSLSPPSLRPLAACTDESRKAPRFHSLLNGVIAHMDACRHLSPRKSAASAEWGIPPSVDRHLNFLLPRFQIVSGSGGSQAWRHSCDLINLEHRFRWAHLTCQMICHAEQEVFGWAIYHSQSQANFSQSDHGDVDAERWSVRERVKTLFPWRTSPSSLSFQWRDNLQCWFKL